MRGNEYILTVPQNFSWTASRVTIVFLLHFKSTPA
jgi:hypothetical protein